MSLRLSNLRVPVEVPENQVQGFIATNLGVKPAEIAQWRIVRKSLDVRDKRQLRFVYNAEVHLSQDESRVMEYLSRRVHSSIQAEVYHEPPFEMPSVGHVPITNRPVVIGSGPAGLVCAYFLALHGYRPLVLERGTPVNDRIRDVKRFDEGGEFHPESNYLFGEGGAGTFSDGKLTCRNTGPDVMRVLQLFAECKGQQPGRPNILYYHRPHLGSNRLPAVVKAIRRQIIALGGEVQFLTRVEDMIFQDRSLAGVATSGGTVASNVVVLAIGHSARDTFQMLADRNVPMSQKPFQFGVRVEHPQSVVNSVQYGPSHDRYEVLLGNADYSLVAHGRNDIFTFCMCAGGYIIPSVSETGYFCTNGMSLSKRNAPSANSGLVVTIPLSEFPGTDVLAGIRLQQQYEAKAYQLGKGEYRVPIQRASDLMRDRRSSGTIESSYPRGTLPGDVRDVIPPVVAEALLNGLPQLNRMWRGRFIPHATIVGPEARGSSPIRIDRDNITRESTGISGLYPIGEGAGYAGGIVSAAVDGLRTAKAIIAKYAPQSK